MGFEWFVKTGTFLTRNNSVNMLISAQRRRQFIHPDNKLHCNLGFERLNSISSRTLKSVIEYELYHYRSPWVVFTNLLGWSIKYIEVQVSSISIQSTVQDMVSTITPLPWNTVYNVSGFWSLSSKWSFFVELYWSFFRFGLTLAAQDAPILRLQKVSLVSMGVIKPNNTNLNAWSEPGENKCLEFSQHIGPLDRTYCLKHSKALYLERWMSQRYHFASTKWLN